MAFKSITTSHFEKRFSKLTGKNKTFKHQIINKMKWIRQNPEMGEPKSHNLRGLRALHISEHFVVVYIIFKNFVIFINLGHHDKAYDSETMNRLVKHLLEDESLLTAFKAYDIQTEDFVDLVRLLGKKK
jgi:mRNA-degrading endonuclease YafQ of YafQ-DinJ toxin-antitoxin module